MSILKTVRASRRIRLLLQGALVVSVPLLSYHASACSLIPCVNGGIEARHDFVVLIKHEGKPLRGVGIEIKALSDDSIKFRGSTNSVGKVIITSLAPGEYWLSAGLLGIEAAHECFHVVEQPSRKARRTMKYDWGDAASVMRQATGRLIEVQPGTGGTTLSNLLHPVTVSIAGSKLQLQNAITSEGFSAMSNDQGEFGFDSVPSGTYVLHVEGGTGRAYEPADLLVKVKPTGTKTTVVLTRGETGCGDIGLVPSWR